MGTGFVASSYWLARGRRTRVSCAGATGQHCTHIECTYALAFVCSSAMDSLTKNHAVPSGIAPRKMRLKTVEYKHMCFSCDRWNVGAVVMTNSFPSTALPNSRVWQLSAALIDVSLSFSAVNIAQVRNRTRMLFAAMTTIARVTRPRRH